MYSEGELVLFHGIGVGRLTLAKPLPEPNGLPRFFVYAAYTKFVPSLHKWLAALLRLSGGDLGLVLLWVDLRWDVKAG